VHAKSSTRPAAHPPVVRRSAKGPLRPEANNGAASTNGKAKKKLLFHKVIKSLGRRGYAVHLKELSNGNHLLVLSEAKRDTQSGEIRKSRLLVFGEDMTAFFRLLHETATFIRANPLPEDIRKRREKYWTKKNREARRNGSSPAE
jgi:hypothetical protein